jgi:hydrogenase small subunit
VGGNVWPIGVGHPCFGCSEKGVGFEKAMFNELSDVKTHTPPNMFPSIEVREANSGISAGAAALTGAAIGAAIGATAMGARKLDQQEKDQS